MKIDVHVSDHAVLRYLERYLKIPVEEVRKRMRTQALPVAQVGARMFHFEDIKFAMTPPDQNQVVTVTTTLERGMDMTDYRLKNNRPHPRSTR